jgi:hypothetical protein
MRGRKTRVVYHIAGWCNWHAMDKELTFYHDEEPHTEQPRRPRKPRKLKYETDEQYSEKVAAWEAMAPHPVEVKPKGNSMTSKYYMERILPGLIEAIHGLR